MPLTSVIIPAYNAAPWIRRAVDSVLAQTHPEMELIVVDDGSTDDTVAQLDPVRNRLVLIQKPNGGQASARNVGIAAARGAWIGLLDADDEWLPEKVSWQLAALQDAPDCPWVYSDAYVAGDSGERNRWFGQRTKLHEGDVLEALLVEDFIPSPTPLIARWVFDEVGGFDESRQKLGVEDWEMWLRIARHYPVACVRQRLAVYHVHPASFSARVNLDFRIRSKVEVIEEATRRDARRLAKVRPRAIARQYLANGLYRLGRGQKRQGLAEIWRSLVCTFAI